MYTIMYMHFLWCHSTCYKDHTVLFPDFVTVLEQIAQHSALSVQFVGPGFCSTKIRIVLALSMGFYSISGQYCEIKTYVS